MGIIKDLKNIFFGASSVTKHAAEKAGDFVKEEGAELLNKGKDIIADSGDIISDKTSGLKDSILDSGSDLLDKTKDKFLDIKDEISSSPIADKARSISEDVGSKVIDTGGEMLEKGKTLSEDVGGKVLEAKDKLMDKAMEVKDELAEKLENTMDKADAWAEAEKAKPKKEFADDTLDASGSLLEGKDDFFSKADKFASGEYDAFSEGKITIDENQPQLEKPKFEEGTPAAGFEDLDGDGNEIIDDAIIDPES